MLDMNSPEFAKQVMDVIDKRVNKMLKDAVSGEGDVKLVFDVSGIVDTTSPLKVFLNNSNISVEVLNPRNYVLKPGDLVVVTLPNFRNDSTKFIDRVLKGASESGGGGAPGADGIGLNYNWLGNSLGVKREDESAYQYVNLQGSQGPKGDKGDKGDTGPQGVPGSDATVTQTNIANALGYVPTSPTELATKADKTQVLTNVPANAKFTDTLTTINGKTGAIAKADIVALGIPAQDTVYTHPSAHPASIITQDSNNRFMTDAERDKLTGIQSGAQVNAVQSVAGKTGAVTLSKSDVGLNNVDNTNDANKPVSTATQNALNLKADLASPTLTGTPKAPTATAGTNTTQIATTAFVQSALSSGGYGDMLKTIYDTDNDGKVDNAAIPELLAWLN